MSLESNETLINGAKIIGANMDEGMSQDEASRKVIRDLRVAQRKNYQERNAREGNRSAALEYLAANDKEYDFVGSPVDESDLIRTLEIQAGENPQELFDESGLQDKSKKQRYEILRERANREENPRKAAFIDKRAAKAAESQKNFDFGLVALGENAVRTDPEATFKPNATSRGRNVYEKVEGVGSGAAITGRSGGMVDAYNSIQAKIATGEIGLDDTFPGGGDKTVRDVLRRIEETEFPAITRQRDVEQGQTAVRDSRRRTEGRFLDSEIADVAATRARRMGDTEGVFDRSDESYKERVSAIESELLARRGFAEDGGFDSNRERTVRNLADEVFDVSRSDLGQAAVRGQQNIDRIQQIKAIGAVKDKNPANMTREAMFDDSASYRTATQMVGPDGAVVGYADPRAEAFLGDINAANTANMQNAPQLPRSYDWVAKNVGADGGRPGATSFGEPSNVDITSTLREFADRVNRGADDGIISDIRSMGEFEGAVDRIIQKAEQKGESLFSFDTSAGTNTAQTAPGIDEVLNKLHYSSPEKARLAQAMYQLGSAEISGVNQDYKDSYAARTAGPTANVAFGTVGSDSTPLARVVNEKVGRGNNRQEVRAALAKLDDPDAARSFIGAVEGEGAPRARFISGQARKMTPDERVRKYGAKNAAIANQVEERYENDRKAKEARLSNTVDPVTSRQRQLDEEFAEKGRQVELDKNALEIGELRRLSQVGASQPADFDLGTIMNGRPRVIEAAPAGRRLVTPSESAFNQEALARRAKTKQINYGDGSSVELEMGQPASRRRDAQLRNPGQPIQQAAVPMSITPEPGAGTGSQAAPTIDAGRVNRAIGGYMNKPDGPGVFERNYRSAPEGPTPDVTNSRRRLRESLGKLDSEVTRRMGRRGRRGAAIAAGIGGGVALGNMITGEREERKEEEMYR